MIKTILNFIKEKGIKYTIKSIFQLINMNKQLNSFLVKGENKSYSQYGEDLFLYRKLGFKKSGFYIDIGANHPSKLSNTKKFYNLGWKGINIEPNPNLINNFKKNRKKDINLNYGISNKNSKLDFYICSNDTLSTFSKSVANELQNKGYNIITKKIEVKKLSEVLDQFNIKNIDFLSLDTEGFNNEVLNSNNWNKYRPKIICIEDDKRYGDMYDDFFKKLSYKKIGFNVTNIIFIDNL